MSQHIQCGMLKTSAAVRPLHNPTTLIKQIQNLQTIHVKSRTIEMLFNMEMRCVTFYLFTKPLETHRLNKGKRKKIIIQ